MAAGEQFIGRTLAHYRIIQQIGAGSMGAVYRAEDLKLKREIALKILPAEVAFNYDRLERFNREARAVAALNHPQIVTIHAVEEVEGIHFIAMELINGKPLSQLIPEKGYALDQFFEIAIPLIDGLSAAHRKGIIHRDLKTTNVMIDESGQVKVIDFGLAKALQGPSRNLTEEASTQTLTMEGMVIGTPSYMSPEQIHGKEVDHRADLFSLGIILHEMLTGESPFEGDSVVTIMSSILKDEPAAISETKSGLPPEISRIIQQCLQKDPGQRFQSAQEILDQFKALQAETAEAKTGKAPSAQRLSIAHYRNASLVMVALAMIGLAGFHFSCRKNSPGRIQGDSTPGSVASKAPTANLVHLTPEQWSYDPAMEECPAYSPDGRQLAFTREVDGYKKLFIQPLTGSGEATQLTFGDTDDFQPSWAPDGGAIAFVRGNGPNGKISPSDVWGGFYASDGDIYLLDLESKKLHLVVKDAYNPDFSRNGILAYHAQLDTKIRIWTCDRLGHQKRPVTSGLDSHDHLEPSWSPDGNYIAFRRQEGKYSAQISVVALANGQIRNLTENFFLSDPVWSPAGDYIYFTANLSSGFNLWRLPVTRQGEVTGGLEPMTFGPGRDLYPALSPDGRELAFTILSWNSDLWLIPADEEKGGVLPIPQPLVVSSREDTRGSFAPDESKIVFTSDRNRHMNLYVARFDSNAGTASPPRQITFGPGGDYQAFWSGDGNHIVFFSRRTGDEEIWRVSIDENLDPVGDPVQLTHNPGQDINPLFSPDGRHIAWQSDRTGSKELWVMNADGSNPRMLSRDGTGGHYTPWFDHESVAYSGRGVTWCAYLDGREPEQILSTGGGHLSFSPNRRWGLDNNHVDILIFPISIDTTRADLTPAYVFEDPSLGVDYTLWSPSGRWILFDRNKAEGGDIFLLTGLTDS